MLHALCLERFASVGVEIRDLLHISLHARVDLLEPNLLCCSASELPGMRRCAYVARNFVAKKFSSDAHVGVVTTSGNNFACQTNLRYRIRPNLQR